MSIAVEQARETREMRLFSALLAAKRKGSLAEFLASRRMPGDAWCTWEEIAIDLHDKTGFSVTREGLRHWAQRYGIPTDSQRAWSQEEQDYFTDKLKQAGISV